MHRGLILSLVALAAAAGCNGVATVYEIKPTAGPPETIQSRVTQIVQRIGDEHAMTPPHSINQQIFIILRKSGDEGGYTGISALWIKGAVRVYVSDWPPGGAPGLSAQVRSTARQQLIAAFGTSNMIVRNTERFTVWK